MKKVFMGSLICPNGILGGGIYLDDVAITFKTNKLTVDKKYRNLVLSLDDICALTWKWRVFPIATIRMTNGEEYKLIIFNQGRFNKFYTEAKRP